VENDGGFIVLEHALSIACGARDAEYQNRIIFRDNTFNLPVVVQQPHPDPNYAPRSCAYRASLGVS